MPTTSSLSPNGRVKKVIVIKEVYDGDVDEQHAHWEGICFFLYVIYIHFLLLFILDSFRQKKSPAFLRGLDVHFVLFTNKASTSRLRGCYKIIEECVVGEMIVMHLKYKLFVYQI